MTRSSACWITITGLDGSGKTTLLRALSEELGGFQFRLPHHQFVREFLNFSGKGTAFGDVHTDRLLFAADARLTNCLIQEWRRTHPLLLAQRCRMDNFIFGACRAAEVGFQPSVSVPVEAGAGLAATAETAATAGLAATAGTAKPAVAPAAAAVRAPAAATVATATRARPSSAGSLQPH